MSRAPMSRIPMQQSLLRAIAALLVALAPAALAQAPIVDLTAMSDLARAEREQVSVPPERAMPLVLWVGPGQAGGLATIDFQQDATQLAVIEVQIPANRATLTPIVVPAALPGRSSTVTVSVNMDDGSRDITVFGQVLGVVDEPLRFGLDRADDLFIMTIGDSSLLVVDRSLAGGGFNPRRQRAGQTQSALARIDAIPMPLALLTGEPRLFDAATAVLVGPPATAVAPAIDRGLVAWVRGGGHVVVPLDGLSDWQALGALIGERVEVRGDELALLPVAVRDGWAIDPATPWLATGPVGLGWATVSLGDPQRLGLGPNEVLERWRQTLAPVAEPYDAALVQARTVRYGDAVSYEISQLLEIEPPDDLAWIVLALLVALALLVGLVDPIVLGRLRLRRLSWLTAAGWIALASVVAWQLPGLVRATRTQAGIVEIIDQGPDGIAHRVGLITLFADSSMQASYDASLGSWWRGVSVPMGAVSRAAFPLVLRDGSLVPSGPIDAAAFTVRTALFAGLVEPVGVQLAYSDDRFVAEVAVDEGWRVTAASLALASGTHAGERLGQRIVFSQAPTGESFFTLANELPTAYERDRAMDHLVGTGNHALVTVIMERERDIEAIRPTLGPAIAGLERRVLRAVVPMPPDAPEVPPDMQPDAGPDNQEDRP